MKIVIATIIAIIALSAPLMADAVEPIAMNNMAVGGGSFNSYTPGVENGVGLNNIGLLIKTWGKVTKVDAVNKFFYIDDGSGRMDGYGAEYKGIRVSYDSLAPGVVINPPAENAYVAVTGISSTVMINGKIQPNIRPRRQSDIQQYSP